MGICTIESFEAPAGFQCTAYPPTETLGCVSVTSLAPGASLSVRASVQITAPAGMQSFAGVYVTCSNPDSDPTNNDAQIITVIAPPSLRITTDPRSLAVTLGEPVAFDVIVTNDGTAALSSLVVTGTFLPRGRYSPPCRRPDRAAACRR